MAQSQIVWAIFSRIAGGPSRSSSNRTSRAAGAIARTSLKVSPSCPNFIEGFAKLPAGQLLDRLGPFLALLPVRDRVDADVEQRGDLRVGEIFGIFERGGIANALGEFDGLRRLRLGFIRVFRGHFPPPHSFTARFLRLLQPVLRAPLQEISAMVFPAGWSCPRFG